MARVAFRFADGTPFYASEGSQWKAGKADYAPLSEWKGYSPSDNPRTGAREDEDARTILGARTRTGTLRRILQATEENRTRTNRKRVMRAAREKAAREKRERREAAEVFVPLSPLDSLRSDVREGRLPRAEATATEDYKLDIGDRHYLTFTLEAPGYMAQLERLYRDYRSERRITEAVMREGNLESPRTIRASVAGKGTPIGKPLYLTASDLQRCEDESDARGVQVFAENARGIQVVSYYRPRGYRVLAVVKRHLREASEGKA